MIVIDASLALKLALVSHGESDLRRRLEAENAPLLAPEIIELEVLQSLRRLLRHGEIDLERAEIARLNFGDLGIARYPHADLAARIWSLRDNLSAYDAAYFALAERLDAPIWTSDGKFSGVPGHSAEVLVF